jgi:hypothetical protein
MHARKPDSSSCTQLQLVILSSYKCVKIFSALSLIIFLAAFKPAIATLDVHGRQNLCDGRFSDVSSTSSVCIIATASCVLALPF